MARPRKQGLKIVRKRRADGSETVYYYDRASGTFLANDLETAIRRQPILCPQSTPAETDLPEDTFGWLIQKYKANDLYKGRSPGTRRLYDGYLKGMMADYGDLPIRSIKPKMIGAIRDKLAATPAKANQTLALFRILLGFAERELEAIPLNPAIRPRRLTAPKRTQVWADSDIIAFMAAAPERVRLGMALLFYTVQRPDDMLALTVENVKERDGRLQIQLRQAKTQEWVIVPVHAQLEPLLRARLSTPILRRQRGPDGRRVSEVVPWLVPSPEGCRWHRRNFSRHWDKALRTMLYRQARALLKEGLPKDQVRQQLTERHRQRRDLRRSGMVKMALAGATTPQIAAVSGHSIESCQKILDIYLPRRGEIALEAIKAWENKATSDNNAESATRSVLTTVLTTDNFGEKSA